MSSDQPVDEEATLIHDKIVPEKVEEEGGRVDDADKKPGI